VAAMKLYGYWRSSSAWRVRIALAWKRLPYEYQPVHLVRDGGEQHGAAYQAINPMEEVPTLELEDHGRTLRITQSLAIIDLLEAMAPTPPLLPQHPFLRARARQLAEIVNAGIQPLQNSGVLARVKNELHGDEAAWARHFITRGLAALEAVSKETAEVFLLGEAVSVADVCLIPQLYNARRFGVPLAAYPTLTRVEGACVVLPAFADSHPDKQPDAPAAGA
jgi:maleylpyruvate isomerase